ncbi:MAG: hypothetical protein R3246_12875 [Acidimicrobiia bacterium]|nr:hypothetical protein [Acidimicrobiia bacterium]
MHRHLLATAVCLVLVGCSTRSATPSPFDTDVAATGRIQLQVENMDFNDATLHAVTDGGRERIGTVSGKGQDTFTIEWPFTRDLRVEINLLASDRYTTPRLTVSPGERVRLRITTPLNRSFLIR